MKINTVQNNTKLHKNFGRYFDPNMMKWFEEYLAQSRQVNPYLTSKDITTMRNSINSFNAFYKGASSVNPITVQNEIYKKFSIPADFKGDKFLASIVALSLNIFKKLNLPLPTMITKAPLEEDVSACCRTMDRSVVFNSLVDWSDTQFEAIVGKLQGITSTGHFLKTALHEFMHNVNIYRLQELAQKKMQQVNSIKSPNIRKLLSMDFYTPKIKEGIYPFKDKVTADYIEKNVSKYAATKPVEMFADIGAKMITDNLNYKTLLPQRHPFAFKDFTEDKYLMQIMNDVWNGNFEKYIR